MQWKARQVEGHQLYYSSTCPYCTFVLITLRYLGLEIQLKNTRKSRAYNAELFEGGGKHQVPCLRIDKSDGDVLWLYESRDIVQYLKTELANDS